MSDTLESKTQAEANRHVFEVYQEIFPNIALTSASNLSRMIFIEDVAATKAAIEYRRTIRNPIAAGAGIVLASPVFTLLSRRLVQNCVLGRLKFGAEPSVDLVAACLQKGAHWGDFDFPNFVNHINDVHNRKSKDHAGWLKQSIKHVRKLEDLFFKQAGGSAERHEARRPVKPSSREIENLQEELPRPKNMAKPKSVLAQALWPILKDSEMATRPAAALLSDALRRIGGHDSSDSDRERESIRQTIIELNKLLR